MMIRSPSFLFLVKKKEEKRRASIYSYVGACRWMDQCAPCALSLGARIYHQHMPFSLVKRGGKKDDDYSMMLLILWVRFGAEDGQGDGGSGVGARSLGPPGQWGARGPWEKLELMWRGPLANIWVSSWRIWKNSLQIFGSIANKLCASICWILQILHIQVFDSDLKKFL
jgi:hypothetical protein